jgi:hypothetical protein
MHLEKRKKEERKKEKKKLRSIYSSKDKISPKI